MYFLQQEIDNRYVSKRFEIQWFDTLCEGTKNHAIVVMKKILTSEHYGKFKLDHKRILCNLETNVKCYWCMNMHTQLANSSF